ASRLYAFEGRCFVLAAGTLQSRADLLQGLELVGGDPDARDLLLGLPDGALQSGGSMIVTPDGTVLAAADNQPDLLVADLDLGMIGRNLTSLDTDGHYARPDLFELHIDRRPRDGFAVAANG